ncbi:hypothetical protein HET69_10090 [Streptomyces sp. CJ_13]|uniref:hypothetical protein n=1 Tax=Streptomyces TaxID=1883 RepID=UPI001AE4102E|nr:MULTISPECIES: hypothetical protein [unclassified Streptomyces]MBP0936309.1 hypothetical protein [Streptomyces sp. KCTC 0041BP]MBT1184360.1 hypothetical protein [Streptomyces sp. CJ_13]
MDRATPIPPRICPNCDGCASVAVTLGGRDRAGHLRTITAHCPACHGTGLRLVRTTATEVRA